MSKSELKPLLGPTTNKSQAFPGIEEIDIMITQDPYGYYCKRDGQRINHYTKETIPFQLPCVNPSCKQGGLELQNIALFYPNGEFDLPCNGHEGTPKGRKKGDPCDNRFKIKLEVKKLASKPSSLE